MPEPASGIDSIPTVPTVTAAQMREVDRMMVSDFGISLLQMMENAGRALAELTRIHLSDVLRRRVVVLAGRGGNGGGGLAAARRLAVWGAEVRVVLARPENDLVEAARLQLVAVKALGIPIHPPAEVGSVVRGADLVLDALVGYSLRGSPRGAEADLIRAANSSAAPIIALDLPSGLDPDSGVAYDPTIHARRTLALALPKPGLLVPVAAAHVGELWLADISVPALAYAAIGITVPPLFARSDLVRVSGG
jgi:NAD(P)H-hydrate epimerase